MAGVNGACSCQVDAVAAAAVPVAAAFQAVPRETSTRGPEALRVPVTTTWPVPAAGDLYQPSRPPSAGCVTCTAALDELTATLVSVVVAVTVLALSTTSAVRS